MLLRLRPCFGWPGSLTCSLTLETVLTALGPGVVLSALHRALWEKRNWCLFGPCGISQEHRRRWAGYGHHLSQGNMSLSSRLSPSMVDPDARHLIIVSPMGAGGRLGGRALGV